jgi:choice-of-anchor A domain-containing protein
MNRKLSVLVAGVGLAGVAEAQQSQLSIYNLIVRNNLVQANHVYGRVITENIDLRTSAGNSGQNVEIGSRLGNSNNDGITPISSQLTPSLMVGRRIQGDANDVVRLINGSALLNSDSTAAPASRLDLQQAGSGALIVRAVTSASNYTAPETTEVHTVLFDSVFNAVVTEASTYSALSASSGAAFATSGNVTTFTIPSSSSVRRVVFNLTESQANSIFNNQNGEVTFNLNGRSVSSLDSVIVNIAGFGNSSFTSEANFTGMVNSDLSFRQRLLWNFYENDNSVILNRNWQGSILAPAATLTGTSNLDGSAAVNNIVFNAEIHGPTWTGVPEPSTYAAVTFAAAAGVLTVWRRRRQSVAV